MPDPISLPNAPIGGNYDMEANACVAAPPAAPPAVSSPTVQIFLPDVVISAGAQQLVDGYAQGAATSPSREGGEPSDCRNEATRAAITCGQMAGAMIVSAPTVLGAAVTGFFGGLACGFATAEAYDCYSKKP